MFIFFMSFALTEISETHGSQTRKEFKREEKTMKRIIILSVALCLGIVLLALLSSESKSKAAPISVYAAEHRPESKARPVPPRMYVADSGMVTLGPNEFLRLTVTPTGSPRTSLTVTFTAQVTQSVCSGGVCTHTVTSENTTSPVSLMPGQGASHDIVQPAGASAVRGMVTGNSPDMRVNGLIIDGATGQSREANYYSITLVNAN